MRNTSEKNLSKRAVLVDLNNFSTFPTLAIGLLVASLRQAGIAAKVIVPLEHDVPAVERERQESIRDHLLRRVHLSTHPWFRAARDGARKLHRWWNNRPHPRVLEEVAKALADGPDVLLLSAYLQHFPTIVEIGRLAQQHGVPVLLGGPVFNLEPTADAWRSIPGITAVIGGEVDLILPEIVATTIAKGDLLRFDGVLLPDGRRSRPAPPLQDLDRLPIPDFTDFPWHRYRLRVIPVMTGRGCQWNRCVFCNDVFSASGRTYRSRSVDAVLHEIEELARRHDAKDFLFLDLKLNSNPGMLRGITGQIRQRVPDAEWIGTVHVDQRSDNGLSAGELRAAADAGMRRISFGLESGSQRLLDAMQKGCSVATNSRFIRDAHAAGLSVRCTMFKGFPGETAEDLTRSAQFLEEHADALDRVRCNEFSIPAAAPMHTQLRAQPDRFAPLRVIEWNDQQGAARYVNPEGASRAFRRAKRRLLDAVYAINSRPVRDEARAFDGLM